MFAYVITNGVNGKRYVGITVNPHLRWKAHLSRAFRDNPDYAISRAIAKYGAHVFRFEVVACCKTWDGLREVECALIRQYRTVAPAGYNMTTGGDGTLGYRHTEAAKEIMREARKRHPITPETAAKISVANKGKVRTKEQRERYAASMRRRGPRSPESIARGAEKRRGRPLSDACKAKLSAIRRGKPKSGSHRAAIGAAHKGRKHTPETKEKMAAAARRRGRQLVLEFE